ncbi:uncharacterized protein EAF01_000520 [Botrytis porri]|uniref:uncharacterized protein n=1 Tax=Botrytis porri TaxID=87229 RepID=UPI001900F3B1|nr:uncharacterized protein EAF01_000520 [Botrytis porri]KAF7914114.1 hypothetical protein EAF01_000520 [Botrytis porri]
MFQCSFNYLAKLFIGNRLQFAIGIYTPSPNEELMARGNLWKSRSKSATTVVPIDKELSERFGLFHLNPIPVLPKNGESPYKLDIVALHGIKGDAFKTWTEKNEDGVKNMWLRDQLPNELPGARIFSFGYDANVLFSRGTGTIEDFATALLEDLLRERSNDKNRKRRIIFICHSMGGIVVKKALIRAFNIKLYRNIFELTSAILFLATPHMGSDETKLPLLISKFANGLLALPMRFSGRVRDELITPLSRGSSVLIETQDEFKRLKLYDGIRVASFLEMDICSGLKGLVVDEESAQLHIPDERVVKMHGCDHRNICRFTGPESSSYKSVWGILKVYADEASSLVEDDLAPEDESLLSSIYYPEMEQRRRNANNAYPGTCNWISQDRSYLRWKETQRSLMWIKGKPGAGKSTLMAYILSNFRHRDSRHLVLNFFFHGRGAPLQKGPEGMYRQLLYQLYSQASPIREELRKSFAEKKALTQLENDCVWTEDELKVWLFNAITWIAQSRPVTLFVDALDEAGDDNARMLVDYFDDMKKSVSQDEDNGSIRICISCRHYPNVTLSEGFEVNVENHNMHDIAVFVHAQLVSKIINWDNDRVAIEGREKMEAAIVKKSLGVFQWVKLVVPMAAETFNDTESLKEVHVMLEKVQDDLAAVYENILTNVIKVKYRPKTLLLMQWVALAERPLTATELRIAMACDDGSENPGQKRWEDSEDYIESDRRMETLLKTFSGGLVEIALYTSGLYRVQFIHQTVVDFMLTGGLLFLVQYLTRKDIGTYENWTGTANARIIGQSQDRLSRSCLNYVKLPDISKENWVDDSEEVEELKAHRYQFFEYAIGKWWVHAEKAERGGMCQKYLVQQLEEPPEFFDKYITLERAIDIHSYGLRDGSTILHLMAYANLQGPAREILKRGDSVEDQDRGSIRPLHCAAYRGHKEMVQLLLDAGADITATQDHRLTALEVAASRAHEDVIHILLERGADINAISNSGTALEGAAASGDVRLVRKLLDIGAKVNQEGHFGSTPLKAAAEKGHVEIVRLLLENGADINHYEEYTGTALQRAAMYAHDEVIGILLENGASINAPGGRHGGTLHCACDALTLYHDTGTTIELLRLLLDQGADVNMYDGPWGSPLAAAINRWGFLTANTNEIDARIILLLEKGADVNPPLGGIGNPLIAAAGHGNINLLSLLLNYGADINAIGGYSNTALCEASNTRWRAHPDAVKFLLDNGADVNLFDTSKENNSNGPPLQRAAFRGRLEIVRLLLDYGADINLGAGQSGGALYEAASCGHLEICELLLNLGADVHAEGMVGTVLHTAAHHGHVDIVRLLLEYGASVDQVCEFGTALQAAAANGHIDVFNLLRGYRADIHFVGGHHHNMLQASAFGGNIEMVRLCLANGIDVNIIGGKEVQTALMAAAQQGHVEIVKLLLNKGARDIQDGYHFSVWYYAENWGHRKVMSVLKERGLEVVREAEGERKKNDSKENAG